MPGKEDREGVVSVPTVNDPILACGAQCFLISNFLEMKKAGVQSQGAGATAENMLALLAICWWVTRISAGLFSSCLQCANAQPDWMAMILLLTHISKVTRRLMQHLHHSSFVIILYILCHCLFYHMFLASTMTPQRRQDPPVAQPAQPAQPAAAPTPVPTVLLLSWTVFLMADSLEDLEAMAQQ